jgi:hypothetical protein
VRYAVWKTNINMRLFYTIIVSILPVVSLCQEIPEKSRFNFAQTTIGVGVQVTSNGQSAYQISGVEETFSIKPNLLPTFYFGGMHFWGHTEIFFAFPLTQVIKQKVDNNDVSFFQNDVVGLKLYPWRLKEMSLRPYIGSSVSGITYRQSNKSPELSGVKFSAITYPVQFGFSFQSKKYVLDLGMKYNWQNSFKYYTSQTTHTPLQIPKYIIGFNFKWIKDGTKASEKIYYSGKAERIYQDFKEKNKLNSFYLALGPSSSFFLGNNDFNIENAPFLNRHIASDVFLDIGLGYFHEKTNAFVDLSYRSNKFELSAYGVDQTLKRQSIALGINKFLFDYHGFAPFIGISLSNENLKAQHQTTNSPDITANKRTLAYGFTIGWDILPTKIEYMTLRTNLRYFPSLQVSSKGNTFSMQQLEFNFIQMVFYPQRFKWLK